MGNESSPRHAAVVTVARDGRLVDVEYAPCAGDLSDEELSREVRLAHASALARLAASDSGLVDSSDLAAGDVLVAAGRRRRGR